MGDPFDMASALGLGPPPQQPQGPTLDELMHKQLAPQGGGAFSISDLGNALGLPAQQGAPPAMPQMPPGAPPAAAAPPVPPPTAATPPPAPLSAPVAPPTGVPAGLPAPPIAPLVTGKGKPTTDQQEARAIAEQKQGIEAGADAESKRVQYLADQSAKAAAALQQRQEQDFAIKQAADQDVAQRRQQLMGEVNQLAQTKINPDRVFADQSTFGRISNAIGILLGGFLAPKNGGKNPAMDIINEQINRDVQAQMADLGTKKEVIGAKQTLLQEDVAAGKDAYDARTKATLAAYDAVKQQIGAYASKFDSPVIAARAQQAIGQLDQQQAQTFEQWQEKRTENAIAGGHLALANKQFEFQKQQAQADFSLKVQEALQKGDLSKAAQLQKQGEQALWLVKDEQGQPFISPVGKEQVAKANETVGAAQQAVSALDRLDELRSKYGSEVDNGVINTDAAKQMNAARIAVVGALKAQFGTRFTEAEAELINKQIGDSATGWRNNAPAWREVRAKLVRDTSQYLQANTGYKGAWKPLPLRPAGAQEDDIANAPPLIEAPGAPLTPPNFSRMPPH